MEWRELKELVDRWHVAANGLDHYDDKTANGDGIQLVLLVNNTKEGNLRLSAMSVRDLFSLISVEDLGTRRDPNSQFPFVYIDVPSSET